MKTIDALYQEQPKTYPLKQIGGKFRQRKMIVDHIMYITINYLNPSNTAMYKIRFIEVNISFLYNIFDRFPMIGLS